MLPAAIVLLATLMPARALVAEPASLSWTGCGVTKKAFMEELTAVYQEKTGVEISLTSGGATRGIRAVGAGEARIGGSCRHTLDLPEEQNTHLIPIAWDALCIVTHKDNPIENITSTLLHQVFSGRILNWEELGATSGYGEIKVYARKGRLSGVGYMSRLMIFSDPFREYAATHVFTSSSPLEIALEKDLNGIGISGSSSARRRKLKILGVDGIYPSFESIQNGRYPLSGLSS